MRPRRTTWDARRDSLAGGRTRRMVPSRGGRPILQREAVEAWCSDPGFRAFFAELLRAAPFEAFFWETPLWGPERSERAFEFVLVDAPSLARVAPDPAAFDEHFADASAVAVFPSLGGDAELVVPTPGPDRGAYAHLAAFARHAPEEQQDSLWRTVGERMQAARDRRVFLSTSGLGVPWVHVRIDERPKYYVHPAYRGGA